MSKLPARNRVIYQSEALFVSPDTTGHHVFYTPTLTGTPEDCLVSGNGTGGATDTIYFDACRGLSSRDSSFPNTDATTGWNYTTFPNATGTGLLGKYHTVLEAAGIKDENSIEGVANTLTHLQNHDMGSGSWGSAIQQLKRVQNANYSFTINRQDVNQFGQLGRIDSVVLEAPTVSLDFSYYLTDGENERLMGFTTNGEVQSLSGIMTRQQSDFGNNYFILTVPEGRDAVGGDVLTDNTDQSVIGLGNAYITDYSVEASVGSFPTASVTVEGLNITSNIGTQWNNLPAVDPENGTSLCDRQFSLPPAVSGEGTSILKPGDISINLKNSALISKQIEGDDLKYDEGSAHVQSFTLSTPMSRTDLQRIGNTYSYSKELDFPVTASLTVNALVADLKSGNLVNLLCGDSYDIEIKMKHPQCIECSENSSDYAMQIDFKGALLDSESFSSAIGDNKSVDLTFSTQIGGPEQQGVGVFISGYDNSTGADGKYKYSPNMESGKYYKYGNIGTTGGFAEDRY